MQNLEQLFIQNRFKNNIQNRFEIIHYPNYPVISILTV